MDTTNAERIYLSSELIYPVGIKEKGYLS